MKLFLFFLTAIALFSCDRKVDNGLVTVSLLLPNRSNATSNKFQNINSILNPVASNKTVLQSVTPLLTSVAIVDTGLNETRNSFNSIQPSLIPNADYPANCYLLVVSGPSTDAEFSTNYCSKDDFLTNKFLYPYAEPISVFTFGNYLGLIDPSNSTGRVTIDVKPGGGRYLTLFAFNSANSCSDVFTALHDKSKLSKAYRLATSDILNLAPGESRDITMTLPTDVDPNDYFTDCTIPDPYTVYPIFTAAEVVQPDFPVNTFRAFSTAQTLSYKCESVDVSLKARDPYTQMLGPGTVSADTQFHLDAGSSTFATYDTEENCSLDTNAQSAFTFVKNQTSQKRWFKQQRQGGSGKFVSFSLVGSDVTPIYVSPAFNLLFTGIFMDFKLPQKIVTGTCYEVTTALRHLDGMVIPSASMTISNTDPNGTALSTDIFRNDSDCEGNANLNPAIAFPFGQNSVSFYAKFHDAGITGFSFALSSSDTSIKSSSPYVAFITPDISVLPESFTKARFVGKLTIPSLTSSPVSELDCFPLFTSLIRSDLTELVGTSTAQMQPLKVRVSDGSGPETYGYSLFSDDACTAPVYPAGSVSSASGTDIAAPASGSSFYKLYVMPDHRGLRGPRKLDFFYGGNIIGSAEINLTDPTH